MRALPRTAREEKTLTLSFFCRKRYFLLAAAMVFFLDRLSKHIIVTLFSEGQSIPVVPKLFHLTRVNNTGAAFGIMREHTAFLTVLTLTAIALLLGYLYKNLDSFGSRHRAGWCLVISGALGNLYDRLTLGYVIDFLDFRVWPVFNIADSAVCVGVFVLITMFFKEKASG